MTRIRLIDMNMANDRFLLATAGDNCIDYYKSLGKMFAGGNPVNVAVYTTRAGLPASYTGAVGDDEYGRFMIDSLKAKDIDTSHVYILPGKTAVSMVELVDNDRVFGDYDEGVLADFKLSQGDIDFLGMHRIVHTAIWGHMEDYLPAIRAKGAKISFDFATKTDGPVWDKALPHTDYAFLSGEEDTEQLRLFMKDIAKMGPELVIVTLGGEGSIAFDGKEFIKAGIVPTEVVDTMGAGDSFIAGFLMAKLKDLPVAACMEAGAKTASETLKYMGAW